MAQMDGWANRWTDGWTEGWTDGWTDGLHCSAPTPPFDQEQHSLGRRAIALIVG